MSNPWFRFYKEFMTDPVVQSLAFEDQRHYTVLLCLKCDGVLDRQIKPSARERIILRGLGLDSLSGEEAKRRLLEVGLISKNWQPKGWNKRQFISDNSTERSRKSRKTKESCNVSATPKNRPCNAPDTEADTETETETEKPSKAVFFLPTEVSELVWADFVQHRKEINKPLKPLSKIKSANILKAMNHDQQRSCVDRSISSGWAGLFPDKNAAKQSKSDDAIDAWLNEGDTISGECEHVKQ